MTVPHAVALVAVAVYVFDRTQDKHFFLAQPLKHDIKFKLDIEYEAFHIPYCDNVNPFLWVFANTE